MAPTAAAAAKPSPLSIDARTTTPLQQRPLETGTIKPEKLGVKYTKPTLYLVYVDAKGIKFTQLEKLINRIRFIDSTTASPAGSAAASPIHSRAHSENPSFVKNISDVHTRLAELAHHDHDHDHTSSSNSSSSSSKDNHHHTTSQGHGVDTKKPDEENENSKAPTGNLNFALMPRLEPLGPAKLPSLPLSQPKSVMMNDYLRSPYPLSLDQAHQRLHEKEQKDNAKEKEMEKDTPLSSTKSLHHVEQEDDDLDHLLRTVSEEEKLQHPHPAPATTTTNNPTQPSVTFLTQTPLDSGSGSGTGASAGIGNVLETDYDNEVYDEISEHIDIEVDEDIQVDGEQDKDEELLNKYCSRKLEAEATEKQDKGKEKEKEKQETEEKPKEFGNEVVSATNPATAPTGSTTAQPNPASASDHPTSTASSSLLTSSSLSSLTPALAPLKPTLPALEPLVPSTSALNTLPPLPKRLPSLTSIDPHDTATSPSEPHPQQTQPVLGNVVIQSMIENGIGIGMHEMHVPSTGTPKPLDLAFGMGMSMGAPVASVTVKHTATADDGKGDEGSEMEEEDVEEEDFDDDLDAVLDMLGDDDDKPKLQTSMRTSNLKEKEQQSRSDPKDAQESGTEQVVPTLGLTTRTTLLNPISPASASSTNTTDFLTPFATSHQDSPNKKQKEEDTPSPTFATPLAETEPEEAIDVDDVDEPDLAFPPITIDELEEDGPIQLTTPPNDPISALGMIDDGVSPRDSITTPPARSHTPSLPPAQLPSLGLASGGVKLQPLTAVGSGPSMSLKPLSTDGVGNGSGSGMGINGTDLKMFRDRDASIGEMEDDEGEDELETEVVSKTTQSVSGVGSVQGSGAGGASFMTPADTDLKKDEKDEKHPNPAQNDHDSLSVSIEEEIEEEIIEEDIEALSLSENENENSTSGPKPQPHQTTTSLPDDADAEDDFDDFFNHVPRHPIVEPVPTLPKSLDILGETKVEKAEKGGGDEDEVKPFHSHSETEIEPFNSGSGTNLASSKPAPTAPVEETTVFKVTQFNESDSPRNSTENDSPPSTAAVATSTSSSKYLKTATKPSPSDLSSQDISTMKLSADKLETETGTFTLPSTETEKEKEKETAPKLKSRPTSPTSPTSVTIGLGEMFTEGLAQAPTSAFLTQLSPLGLDNVFGLSEGTHGKKEATVGAGVVGGRKSDIDGKALGEEAGEGEVVEDVVEEIEQVESNYSFSYSDDFGAGETDEEDNFPNHNSALPAAGSGSGRPSVASRDETGGNTKIGKEEREEEGGEEEEDGFLF
ncbi:hypothetical protein HK102_003689, partial [Quaeritorhiza haematococci]